MYESNICSIDEEDIWRTHDLMVDSELDEFTQLEIDERTVDLLVVISARHRARLVTLALRQADPAKTDRLSHREAVSPETDLRSDVGGACSPTPGQSSPIVPPRSPDTPAS